MFDDPMTAQTRDLHAARRAEAEAFHRMIDAAPLRFRRHTFATARRSVAKALIRLAGAIDR
jgi:hypothetical protein